VWDLTAGGRPLETIAKKITGIEEGLNSKKLMRGIVQCNRKWASGKRKPLGA